MGISNKMEFVTITIYETTTLEIKATIALLFWSSLTMLVALKAKPKSVPAAHSEFLFDNI